MILPFALDAVGGLEGLRASVDDPTLFSIVAPGEITLLYVVVIAVNALVGWVTSPYSMQMTGAARTENDARVGLVAGMFLKRIVTVAWVLTGMCAVGLYAGTTIDPDQVYGLMARDLLPTIAPGLIGLFIASMLAAVMSSCDCLMVASAALFTENIYRPYIRPDRDERHYVLIGRLTSIAVVLAGLFVAFALPSVEAQTAAAVARRHTKLIQIAGPIIAPTFQKASSPSTTFDSAKATKSPASTTATEASLPISM